MSYIRVCPRDLFNEANLLKCLGKLTLLVHDEEIQGLNFNHEAQDKGFVIDQDEDGAIHVINLHFFDDNGTPVDCDVSLNNRYKWPLVIYYKGSEYHPFNEKGEYQLDKKLFLA